MGALIVVASCVCAAAAASWFMWRATSRSVFWSMAAGALLALAAVGGAVVIAWLLTRAAWGPAGLFGR